MSRTGHLVGLALAASLLAACSDGKPPSPDQASTTPAGINVLAESVAFEPLHTGSSSTKSVILRNTGKAVVELTLALEGEDAASFSISMSTLSLEPWTSAELQIGFAPARAGEHEASLTVRHGPLVLRSVALSGTAVDLACSVDVEALDLGTVIVGATRTGEVVLSNSGEFPWEYEAELLGAGAFEVSHREGRLEPGASARLSITFAPALAEESSAVLALRAGTCRKQVALSGRGATAIVIGEEVDFGPIVPSRHLIRQVRVFNHGREPVTVTARSIAGDEHGVFSMEADDRLNTIPAEGSMVFAVKFAPRDAHAYEASLQLDLDHPVQKRVSVGLRGQGGGPRIYVDHSLYFGTVALGAWNVKRLSVWNDGKDLPDRVDGNLRFVAADGGPPVRIIVDAAGAFSVELPPDGLPPNGLPPDSSLDLKVKFVPPYRGNFSATLQIHSNVGYQPVTTVHLSGNATERPDCTWEWSVPTVDFGDVSPRLAATRTVALRNVGSTPCYVYTPMVTGDEAFSLAALPSSETMVAPGGALELEVQLSTALRGSHTGALELITSSRDATVAVVPLRGNVTDVCVGMPPKLEFGRVPAGCAHTRRIDLVNVCGATETLTAVATTGPSSFSFSPLAFPMSLEVGVPASLEVTYAPEASSRAEHAELAFTTSSGRQIKVQATGEASFFPGRTERFTAWVEAIDVLFVIDDSSGMSRYHEQLAIHAQRILDEAQTRSYDHRVGVITTTVCDVDCSGYAAPNGQLTGSSPATRLVSRATSNPATVLAANLRVGDAGSDSEQPLEAIRRALSPAGLEANGVQFPRPGARLHVVVVTNAADESPGQLAFYEAFFRNLVASKRTRAVTVSAVAPLSASAPPGCEYDTVDAGRSTRLRDFVALFDGTLEEICDFGSAQSVEALAQDIFKSLRSYQLGSPVDVTKPLQVRLNRVSVPELEWDGQRNWSFDAANNAVRLEPGLTLSLWDELLIEYDIACQ